ncbi:hypothetical protein HUJ04_001296 [Dendroctonus ponderosae]|nr:hypothetical protein HUJ04_001296 [Dendroctonus ponderosae]
MRLLFTLLYWESVIVGFSNRFCSCKYVEGTLKTNQNWAFLARFCFLSEEGQFEYVIDYKEDQGDINLLLYYDTDDQWPAVYKSAKTCEEREAVLNVQQNQLVNMTARGEAARQFAGCTFGAQSFTTPTPLYTINIPTPKRRNDTSKGTVAIKTSSTTPTTTTIRVSTQTAPSLEAESFGTTAEVDQMSTWAFSTESSFTSSQEVFEASTPVEVEASTNGPELLLEIARETTMEPHVKIRKSPIKKRSVPTKAPKMRPKKSGRFINCHNARRFRSARERWWFIAVSNCKATKGIDLNYQLLMTNGPPGDYWREHFSADEFYILPILMGFSIAYSFLMLGITVCSLELKQRQLLHTTYKIFVLSCVLQLLGILLMSIAYLKMAVSGRESPKTKRVGKNRIDQQFPPTNQRLSGNMLLGASETCYLLLLLLLAKGFTITRGRLPLKGTVKLTIFMCVYVTTYLTIFVYEAVVFDPGEVLYLYESPAGYSLITLRLCGWAMFIYSTVFTLKRYPEKSNFYYPFNIFGTIWFVAGPAFVLSANAYIDKWVRESVVYAVLLFIAFGGHLMFLILTMPSVANKNFPYHVRTTQIGIMEVIGTAGTSSIEQFGHHAYEPSLGGREHTVIIPLTRRTEEIFEGGMYNQKRFSRAQITELPNDLDLDNGETARDAVMENVLSWSLAKSIPAVDFAGFDKIKHRRDSIGSATSKLTENSFQNEINTRRPSLSNHLTLEDQNVAVCYEELVSHVPVDLFTISKAVDAASNEILPNGPYRKLSK